MCLFKSWVFGEHRAAYKSKIFFYQLKLHQTQFLISQI